MPRSTAAIQAHRGRTGYTVMFLRMTATEMRKLAENTPEIAQELGYIAEQVETEAESLAGHIAE